VAPAGSRWRALASADWLMRGSAGPGYVHALRGCGLAVSFVGYLKTLSNARLKCDWMSQTPIADRFYVASSVGGQSIGRNFFCRIGHVVSSGGLIYGAINDELNVLVGSSRGPAIEIDFAVGRSVVVNCTLIGELQNPL
jgi:hypothetical protein